MKTMRFLALLVGGVMLLSACDRTAGARYIDLSTGKEVELVKDENSGLLVDATTKQPVYLYVDTKKNDTIYGRTGEVINGRVIVLENGSYRFDGEDEATLKDGKYKNDEADYKLKVEDDGDIKIKDGDKKIKVDDGGKKVKND